MTSGMMFDGPQDQRPPANLEAEQALLVAILADNRQLDDIPDDFSAEHFADGPHARIYQACCSLVAKSSQANAVTLSHLFEADEDLADIGGKAYLAQLQAAIPMGRARDYAGLITELWRLRQLLVLCQGTIREIRESAADRSSSDLVTGITAELDRIDDAKETGHLLDAGAAAEAWVGTVVQPAIRARDSGRVIGVPMSLKPMDERLAGLRPGKLIILGAATSQFKSSLGIWIARQSTLTAIRALMDQGASLEEACRIAAWTFVWSGEMDAAEQTGRMLAQATAVPYEDQSSGSVNPQQAALVAEAAAAWRDRPLLFADKPHLHINELSRIVRRLHRQRGLRLVVVDYIQQIRGSDSRSREREVAEVAAHLKELAMELHVPVLAMAQLSRQFFQREDKRPMLSDLRESGAVEQYADVVLFNHNEHHWLKQGKPIRRPNEPQEKFDNRWADWRADVAAAEGKLDIIIAKYRGGQAGRTVTVGVHPPTARFFPLDDKPADLQPVPDSPDGFL